LIIFVLQIEKYFKREVQLAEPRLFGCSAVEKEIELFKEGGQLKYKRTSITAM
jgi:hypothetical protein